MWPKDNDRHTKLCFAASLVFIVHRSFVTKTFVYRKMKISQSLGAKKGESADAVDIIFSHLIYIMTKNNG